MTGKIISIVLLFGMITSSVTNYLLFQLQIVSGYTLFSVVKNTRESGLEQIFIYTGQPEFHWENRNKEFSYNGKLFDVISTKDTRLGLKIRCIADREEDNIVSSYLNRMDTTKNNKGWISFLKLKPIYFIPAGIFVPNPEIVQSNLVIILNSFIPSSPYLEIFSPPPKQYCAPVVG